MKIRNTGWYPRVRRRASERGNSLVEFALVAPMLTALFLGAVQFGYVCYAYERLSSAVRAGARYGSMQTYEASAEEAYTIAVKNIVVYGDPAGGGKPLLPGLIGANVEVSVMFTKSIPSDVDVQIVGYQMPALLKAMQLNGKPRVRFPYMGRYVPETL
jgi:hypothetical protein